MMKVLNVIVALLVVGFVSGCMMESHQEVQPTATLMPTLTSLPVKGRVPCSDRTNVFLNESPGSIPPDPNSGGPGGLGQVMGEVGPCMVFTITQVTWSKYNQEYYVYAETTDAKGWIGIDLIEVLP
jgi:hypothetical protein